jgi:hypothetical protein
MILVDVDCGVLNVENRSAWSATGISLHSVKFPSASGLKHPISGMTMRLLFYLMTMPWLHGLINYKDTKTKCRHLKKLTGKGT